MLFTQQTEHLNSTISSIQNEIDELENKLIQLREEKANLEAEKQTILTLESAAESAINQVENFIGAAESLGRQDLINTFWDALDNLESGRSQMAQLPEASDPDTTQSESPTEPTPPTEPFFDTAQPESNTLTPTNGDTTEQPTQPSQKAVRPFASVGSCGFDLSQATLDELKRWVRSHQDDSDTRTLGKLTSRKTWELAAKQILVRIAVETDL